MDLVTAHGSKKAADGKPTWMRNLLRRLASANVAKLEVPADIVPIISLIQDHLNIIKSNFTNKIELIRVLRLMVQLKGAYEGLEIVDPYNNPPARKDLALELRECELSLRQLRYQLENAINQDRDADEDLLNSLFRQPLEKLARTKVLLELAVKGDFRNFHDVLREESSLRARHYNDLLGSDDIESSRQLAQLVKPSEDKSHLDLEEENQVENQVRRLHDIMSEKEAVAMQDRICQWLYSADPSSKHYACIAKRQPGSGEWFLSSTQYYDWKQGLTSFIWLHGIPGSGKTILCSAIIEDTLQYCANEQNLNVAYFYFDFADAQKQGVLNLVRPILAQLVRQKAAVPDFVRDFFERYQAGEPPMNDMILVLAKLVQESKETFLIVDAIDECVESIELCQLLIEITGRLVNLKILATSRREAQIEQVLSKADGFQSVQMNTRFVVDDIRLYISSQVEQNSRFKKWPSDVKTEIIMFLVEGSKGMFSWANCQLESLSKCLTVRAVRTALRTLPPTLDETYTRMLLSIDEEYHDMAFSAFQWLAFSTRPLSIFELAEAVAIKPDTIFDTADRLPNPFDILTVLSSFLTVHEVSKSEFEALSMAPSSDSEPQILCPYYKAIPSTTADGSPIPMVQFSHTSVREFLLSEHTSISPVRHFSITKSKAQSWMVRSCLQYIHFHAGLESAQLKSVATDLDFAPLMRYACTSWSQHAKACDGDPDSNTVHRICDALASPLWVSTWLKCCTSFDLEPSTRSPLFYAALLGLEGPSFELVNSGTYIAATEMATEMADILCAAILSENRAIVKRLVSMGFNVNGIGSDGKSPLYVACENGFIEIVKLLIEYNSDPNLLLGQHGSMLHAAVRGGRIDVAELLIQRGSDVDLGVGDGYGPPLQLAAASHNTHIIQYLLTQGANVNARGGLYGTAIQAAVGVGDVETVRALLAAGANVNVTGGVYGSALQAAAWRASESTLHILTDHGANVNVRGQESIDPIWFIFSRGSDDLVKLILEEAPDPGFAVGNSPMEAFSDWEELLDRLANPDTSIPPSLVFDAKDRQQRIRGGNMKLIRLLGDTIINHDLLHGQKIESLMAMAGKGSIGTLQLLLHYGTEISAAQWRASVPGALGHFEGPSTMNFLAKVLQYSKVDFSCRSDVLTALIAAGQQYFAAIQLSRVKMGGMASSPLHIASIRGSLASTQLLLDRGADVSSKDLVGRYAVHHAAFYGHEQVLKLLLETGADPNVQQPDGRTPLHLACMTDQLPAAAILVESGTYLEAQDYTGQTPLHIAASNGNTDLLRLLVTAGADIEPRNYRGTTPLHIGSSIGNENVVEILLQYGASRGVKDDDGKTPIDYANKMNEGLRELLQDIKGTGNF